jgi:thiol-disulfide isomerase/thioredoxin
LFFSVFLSLCSILACGQAMVWNCGLLIQQDTIRFELHRTSDGAFYIQNGEEQVPMVKKREFADSLEYEISVFDATLIFPSASGKQFGGWYRKHDARIPSKGLSLLAGITGEPLYVEKGAEIAGNWPLDFMEGEKVQDKGILVLSQNRNILKGSILTETGDYRYLNGRIRGNKAFLQTFDGGHAWYFRLEFSEDGKSLNGDFLYSQTGKQTFRGVRDPQAKLASGFSEVKIPDRFHFAGINASGKKITRDDFAGKGLVVQVMGSWCPNCLDETRFLSEEFPFRPPGVEFVGLAFERKDDPAYAKERIAAVSRRLVVPYPILHAGKANKDSASKALPQAGGIRAFPTTIFVKANGEILKIHSGFSGPATGEAYMEWRKEFRALLKQISP